MISYKVLIILTVIFYIITYCNGGSQESDDDILQRINESDEYKKCNETLTKFGLQRDSGYYNLVFTLQYKKDIKINDESFLGRLERKFGLPNMRVPVAPENEIDQKLTEQEFMDKYDINKVIEKNHHLHDLKSVIIEPLQDTVYTTLIEPVDAAYTRTTEIKTMIEITSFMYTFYKDVIKVDYTEIELWMDPFIFCTAEIMKKSPVEETEKNLINIAFGVLKRNGGFIKKLLKVFKADENIENEEPAEKNRGIEDRELDKEYTKIIAFAEKEENKQAISGCSKSLDEFDVEIGGKRYKFNEHNVFWSSIVAMILNFFREYIEAETIINDMTKYQRKYYDYIISYYEKKNPGYYMFTIPSLCQTYAYEKIFKEKNSTK